MRDAIRGAFILQSFPRALEMTSRKPSIMAFLFSGLQSGSYSDLLAITFFDFGTTCSLPYCFIQTVMLYCSQLKAIMRTSA